MEATKKCTGCGRELPLSEFNKKRNTKDGLQSKCRACFSAYNRNRYASDRNRFKNAVKEYRKNNPDKALEARLATNRKNPTKQNARRCVEAALKAGALNNPQVCSGCGCTPPEHRIEAHHHDYSKPLDVIWLCTPRHRRMDQQRSARERKGV